MHQYKNLTLWKKSIDLVTRVYGVTEGLPDRERFGLVSQINRAAVSIPSNIAEGAGRNSEKEFKQFLAVAHASSFELETQLMICVNLGYIMQPVFEELLEKVGELQKMNYALQMKLNTKY